MNDSLAFGTPDRTCVSKAAKVVAIDGPAASGKGTLAIALAKQLGWNLLDSGVLYRAVGYLAQHREISIDTGSALADVLNVEVAFEFSRDSSDSPTAVGRTREMISVLGFANDAQIYHNGQNITGEVRSGDAAVWASRVAAHADVRRALIDVQRQQRRAPGLVADGRDMGTVVFLDADLKIFLDASLEARAERRRKQLQENGSLVSYNELLETMRARDERDRSRSVAPLVAAKDAILVECSSMNAEETLNVVLDLVREAQLI